MNNRLSATLDWLSQCAARPAGRRVYPAFVIAMVVALVYIAVQPARADSVEIQIRGVNDKLTNNVRKSLSLAEKHKKKWSPAQIQRLYRLAPSQIKRALAPYGYYNPVIDKQLKAPTAKGKTKNKQHWRAVFKIKHGPATHVKKLNLAVNGPGDELPAIRDALRETQLAKGRRLVHADYDATKGALAAAARQAGYLDAHFTQSAIKVRPKTNSAEIDLVMETGERYYFGAVTLEQNVLNDKLAHRFVPFSPGEPFDADKLVNMQLALADTDYFDKIEIQAERDQARRGGPIKDWLFDLLYPPEDPLISIGELRIPIVVKAGPSKPQSYTISGGYGTDTGPRVGLGVKFRHLNKAGHQFHSELRLSQIKQSLQAAYDIPIQNVIKDKLSFTAQVKNELFGDVMSINYGVGVVRDTGWALGRKRAYINLERETYDLGDAAGNRTSTLLYPGYTLTLKKADDLLAPRKGVSLSLDVHGGSDTLASSTNFVQAKFTGNAVLPLTSRSRLLLRSELGATGVDDFKQLPPSQRFFTGGDRTVRGYAYQTISPTNDGGNKDIGGRYLAVASVETDYRVYKKFGVAAFFDAGDAADSTHFDFKRGVGVGLRYASPIGMVRLDFAHPLDDPDSNFRFHFSLGPDL